MSSTVILGCAYGDEGKAKIVDYITNVQKTDIVVRFQGGSNAGHTIQFDNKKYVMHLIPSGIFNKSTTCVLASGVVLDPEKFLHELDSLVKEGIEVDGRILLDERINIVLPIHKFLEQKLDKVYDIGTTKQGIGTCYSNSILRTGIRLIDIINLDEKQLMNKLIKLYKFNNKRIKFNYEEIINTVHNLTIFANRVRSNVINSTYYLNKAYDDGLNILFEGAQASLLDIYFGTYPYVTSSHTTIGGVCVSTGVSHKKIDNVIGIFKAYFTRVGSGPFPTELKDDTGDYIRKQGNEFGSTTGRPRRCGWFDLVAAKHSVMINGLDSICLMLIDVLDGMKEIKVCKEYLHNGIVLTEFPTDAKILEEVIPVYDILPGWSNTTDCKSKDDLPINCINYIKYLEDHLGVKVLIASVGPKRDQTINY